MIMAEFIRTNSHYKIENVNSNKASAAIFNIHLISEFYKESNIVGTWKSKLLQGVQR